MRPAPLRGPAFEAFVAPARRRRGLWRLLLGACLAGLVAVLAGALIFGLGIAAPGARAEGATTLLVLFCFAGLTLGVLLAARLFDGRGPTTLIGPGGIRLRAFAGGMLVAAGFAAVATLGPALVTGVAVEARMTPGAWLGLLPVALVAVLVQTSAEELAFRAYLAQGLAARSRARVVWLGIPAALFGTMHWSPATFGQNAPLVVLCAAAVGVILGDVTARAGNLSLALGLHFGNNLASLLVIAPPAPLDGLALYASVAGAGDFAAERGALLAEFALLSAGYGLWLRWNHREFGPRGFRRRDRGG